MRITTKAQYIWSDRQNRYILLSQEFTDWTGDVALAKGATGAQMQLQQEQANFYNTLSQDYSTQFANQSAILKSLNAALSPIVAAGPNQYGFSSGETAALNAQAVQGAGQAYAHANTALRTAQAAQGGGNVYLPSGVQQQEQAALAASSAATTANEEMGVQQAGYQQGYNQFQSAIGQLSGVAGMYNPTGYAGSANQAGSAAGQTAQEIQQENAAASPWNVVGGLLGGAVSGMTGGLVGDLGTAVSKVGSGNWGW
jgi:hypothetical protein